MRTPLLTLAALLFAACGPRDSEPPPENDAGVASDIAAAFPDYRPKLTADDLFDYRPAMRDALNDVPDAALDALPELIRQLGFWRDRARNAPGAFEPGAVALGADPEEYRPSESELIWAVVGERVATVAAGIDAAALRAAAPPDVALPLTYPVFDVRHVDVMGSGRFFYVSEPDIRDIEAGGG